MKRLLIVFLLFLLPSLGLGQGLLLLGVGGTSSSPPSYQGPGDIVSGATVWVGLRAYSSGDRGNRLVNVCIPADVACADLISDVGTGALVIPTIGGSSCSVVTCTVKIFYDRSGANACSSSACDFTQSTIANRATLIVSCVNSLPCARVAGAATYTTGGSGNLVQPNWVSAVVTRTAAFTTAGPWMGDGGGGSIGLFAASANQVQTYGGASIIVTASDSAWHSIQSVFNGASSDMYVDGSSTTGDVGTNVFSFGLKMFNDNFGNLMTGDLTEVGLWNNVVPNGTQKSNMNANQHTYWGF